MYPSFKTQPTGIHATMEEAIAALNQPFLTRQVRITPRNNEEAFKLFTDTLALAHGKPLQVIATPGVDATGNAYFYIGLRVERQEIDMKLSVNEAIIGLVLAFMSGAENYPHFDNLVPMKISEENKVAWYHELEKQLMDLKAVRKEKIEFTQNGSYHKVIYKLPKGKITINQGRVENLLQLLTA